MSTRTTPAESGSPAPASPPASRASAASTPSPPSTAETKGPAKHIVLALLGPMAALLLAMLDNFVVGTSMPRIVGELGGVEHLSWVTTAYILASTVSAPIYGKLGDLFGRQRLLVSAIGLFLAGSMLSGLATSMATLIGFRALQGLGAGGLMVTVFAIIGDLVPPRDRGKYQGLTASVMAIAMIGGPLAGGFLTDHLSWRWAFYINVPIGLLSLGLIAVFLRLPRHTKKVSIDWLGAALITVGATALVLLTTWGGTEYDWASPQIIGLAVVGVVAVIALIFVERRVVEPMLPLRLFKSRNFALVVGIGAASMFGMFGTMTFIPIFQQTVQGASATNSGLLMLPMLIPVLLITPIVGQAISRTGRYKIWLVLGGLAVAIAFVLLAQLDVTSSMFTTGAYMALLGAGLGTYMQIVMLIGQNSVEMRDMGSGTSTLTFFRTIGGSFGIALFGAIFTGQLRSALPGGGSGSGSLDPAAMSKLPPEVHDTVIGAIATAVQHVFWWGVPFAILAFVLTLFVKEVPLKSGAKK